MPANRDVAASIGMPAAVDPHPGFQQHLNHMKMGRSSAVTKTSQRSGQRGMRLSRRAYAR